MHMLLLVLRLKGAIPLRTEGHTLLLSLTVAHRKNHVESPLRFVKWLAVICREES